jgi:hypothetical protein
MQFNTRNIARRFAAVNEATRGRLLELIFAYEAAEKATRKAEAEDNKLYRVLDRLQKCEANTAKAASLELDADVLEARIKHLRQRAQEMEDHVEGRLNSLRDQVGAALMNLAER